MRINDGAPMYATHREEDQSTPHPRGKKFREVYYLSEFRLNLLSFSEMNGDGNTTTSENETRALRHRLEWLSRLCIVLKSETNDFFKILIILSHTKALLNQSTIAFTTESTKTNEVDLTDKAELIEWGVLWQERLTYPQYDSGSENNTCREIQRDNQRSIDEARVYRRPDFEAKEKELQRKFNWSFSWDNDTHGYISAHANEISR